MAADLMDGARWATMGTPIGDLAVFVSDEGVVETTFDVDELPRVIERLGDRFARITRTPRELTPVRRELRDYFAGRLRSFTTAPDLAWLPPGFSRRVLEITATIPYGELWTYGDVAGMAGSRRGGRAAGNALNRCPVELFVPCHRVVHAGGTLGGYGRHEERKRWLIRHERSAA